MLPRQAKHELHTRWSSLWVTQQTLPRSEAAQQIPSKSIVTKPKTSYTQDKRQKCYAESKRPLELSCETIPNAPADQIEQAPSTPIQRHSRVLHSFCLMLLLSFERVENCRKVRLGIQRREWQERKVRRTASRKPFNFYYISFTKTEASTQT